MRLTGRVALVTGASSGIGASTARELARRGARVALAARSAGPLDELAAAIRDAGGEAVAFPVDCGSRDDVARLAERVEAELGVPDVLVNNAGAGRFLFFDETEPEELEAMMAVPYLAAAYVTKAFLPRMLERGDGVVVLVNSPVSLVVWPGAAGYAAARWAVRGLAQALRADLAGTGVRVTEVVPGTVASGYFEHNPGTEDRLPRVGRLVRRLSPDEVGQAIADAVERDRRLVFTPFALRLLVTLARLAPRTVERVVVASGARRPERLVPERTVR